MPGKGFLLVHSEEDVELTDSVMEHLGVLETVTKFETKTVESLDRLGTVALKNKLKGRKALVLLLSAPLLSSKFLRQRVVQDLADDDGLLLLAGRPCAWRIVPWLDEVPVWPEEGCLTDKQGLELDAGMAELAYGLAARLETAVEAEEATEPEARVEADEPVPSEPAAPAAAEPEMLAPAASIVEPAEALETKEIEHIEDPAEIVDLETNENDVTSEEIVAAGEPEAVTQASNELAAGPAPLTVPALEATIDLPEFNADESLAESLEAGVRELEELAVELDGYSDGLLEQFDRTCEAVLPKGTRLDDEILAALIELTIVQGDALSDADDLEGAGRIYLHTATRVVELINGTLADGQSVSSFLRNVRLSMWRCIKEAEGDTVDIDALRASFEDALETAAIA